MSESVDRFWIERPHAGWDFSRWSELPLQHDMNVLDELEMRNGQLIHAAAVQNFKRKRIAPSESFIQRGDQLFNSFRALGHMIEEDAEDKNQLLYGTANFVHQLSEYQRKGYRTILSSTDKVLPHDDPSQTHHLVELRNRRAPTGGVVEAAATILCKRTLDNYVEFIENLNSS